MEVDYLLDSESDLLVIPRSILERFAGQYLVNEVPVDVFEIGLARSSKTWAQGRKILVESLSGNYLALVIDTEDTADKLDCSIRENSSFPLSIVRLLH